RLSRPRVPYQGDAVSKVNSKGNVLQDPIFFLIREPYILEFDPPLRTAGLLRRFRRCDVDITIEQNKNAMRCDDRRLKDIEFIRQVAYRLKKLQGILDERR